MDLAAVDHQNRESDFQRKSNCQCFGCCSSQTKLNVSIFVNVLCIVLICIGFFLIFDLRTKFEKHNELCAKRDSTVLDETMSNVGKRRSSEFDRSGSSTKVLNLPRSSPPLKKRRFKENDEDRVDSSDRTASSEGDNDDGKGVHLVQNWKVTTIPPNYKRGTSASDVDGKIQPSTRATRAPRRFQRCSSCQPGPPGNQGRPGPRGPKGNRGKRGKRGLKGEVGLKGGPGARGPMGPPGRDGRPGKSGLPGVRGRPGPPGKIGPQGAMGPIGPRGAPGLPGTTKTNRPSAHITGYATSPRAPPPEGILRKWEESYDFAHHIGGMKLENGELRIPKSGRYFIYSQIYFQADDPDADPVMVHFLYRVSTISQNILLRSIATRCHAPTAKHAYYTGYHGGVFRMKEGDRLMVGVSKHHVNLVSNAESASYFGAFLID